VLLFITLLWGATFTIVKESLHDINPMLFIAIRFSLATIFILPFVFKHKLDFQYSSVKAGMILGALMFFSFGSQTIGLKFTTATKSGFLTGTLVVLIPIFQYFIEKKKPGKGAIIGVIIVFIGILFLSSGGNSIFSFLHDLGNNLNQGDFFTLVCAILFAIHVVYLDIFSKRENVFVLFFMQIFITALLGLLFTFLFDYYKIENIKFIFSDNLIFGLIYTAFFATIITTALQTKYQQFVQPTNAGIIYSFEPIFSALIAFFALNEKITNFGLVGCILIFIGLISSEIFENINEKWKLNKAELK
jgi:drug/metabolite transporter (DMT)-like permease